MRINNNLMAMNTHRQLGISNTAGARSMEKLSSGLRINKAGDDAAGLAISEKMRGQIRGLTQASRNSQDGISMIQTAEGALSETHAILQRMRELAVQASNDTNVSVDRDEIQKEINQLTSEITRIGNNTEFNTKKVINGDMTGPGAGAVQEKQTLTLDEFTPATAHGGVKLNIGGEVYTLSFDHTTNAGAAGMAVDAGNKTVTVGIKDVANQIGTDLQAVLNNLKGALPNSALSQFDITSTGTTISFEAKAEGTFAGGAGSESVKLTSGLLAQKLAEDANGKDGTGGMAQLQIGANNGQQFAVEIGDMRALANLKISGTTGGANQGVVANAVFTSVALTDKSGVGDEFALDVTSATKATAAIEVLDKAIGTVSAERSKIGAFQNRLEHSIKNLDTSSENLQAAESRVRDVDMAKEMMEMTKNNILQQAAQAMLAQANQAPEGVLQLLR